MAEDETEDPRFPDIDAQPLLGWKPTIDIDEGLKRTIEWFKGGM